MLESSVLNKQLSFNATRNDTLKTAETIKWIFKTETVTKTGQKTLIKMIADE